MALDTILNPELSHRDKAFDWTTGATRAVVVLQHKEATIMTRRPLRASSRDRRGDAMPMFLFVLSFRRGPTWRRRPPRNEGPSGAPAAPRGPFHHARPTRELPHHPVVATVPNANVTIREREDA